MSTVVPHNGGTANTGFAARNPSDTDTHPPSHPTHTFGNQKEKQPLGVDDPSGSVDGKSTCRVATSSSSSAAAIVKLLSKLLGAMLLGFVFGIAMEKTRVFEPKSVRLQMVFEKWIMLKMFLAALASSLLSISILSLIPLTREKYRHASDEFVTCVASKGVVTSCLGPCLLGVGMTLSGACPGMVLVQVGTWTPNAIFTLIGCLVGALLYGMLAPCIEGLLRPREPLTHQQLHTTLGKPFAALAIPTGLCVAVVVILLEVFLDYRDDLENPEKLSDNIATTIAWSPYAGGILVGLLQIPMILLLEDTIGGSSSYVTVMSQWVVTSQLQQRFPYLAAKRTGLSNWWQVLYVGGAILGGLASAAASDSLATVQGVGVAEAVCGGVVMLLGARLAGGCTSGHGISGVGLLAWLSFLAVPCMFGGAIATAYIMRAADCSLDRLVNSTLTV
ncbi:thiosulfate transporter TsuA-like [Littorina saxatilis]|uniref:Sulphur transport domain-containing protein n=1 Tax=Littorina saxatilis TaxID=31220 RepID=A0AAN9BNI8_9CAEN